MLPGKTYTPEDILRILWRRKWLLLVPLVVASITSTIVAWWLPEKYRSETVIQVLPQRIPESYVRSTVTTRIQTRLEAIEQIIKSRSRLERIIEDLNLFPDERKVLPMEEVVARMQLNIEHRVQGVDSFRVVYTAGDPVIAQRVADRLGLLFIDENLRDREALAEQTSQFLNTQLEDARKLLLDREKRLEEYRSRYSGELPSQTANNLQAKQNTQMRLQALSETMNRDRERRTVIERQVGDLQATEGLPPVVTLPPGNDAPLTGSTTAELLEAELAARRNLLGRYKPDHPDVGAANRRIRDLQAKLQAEASGRPTPDNAPARPVSPAEILRQNRLRSLQASLDDIDRALAANRVQEQRLLTEIGEYEAKINSAPKRESELTELMRDYETLKGIYTSLLAKREDSKLAASVERQQIGEQFKVIDAARVPERPFSPNRPGIVGMGVAIGLGLAVGLIALLEYRDSTFKTEDEVLRVLQIPVLALIPMMASEMEGEARRRRKLLTAVAVIVMLVSSAAALVVWKLQA